MLQPRPDQAAVVMGSPPQNRAVRLMKLPPNWAKFPPNSPFTACPLQEIPGEVFHEYSEGSKEISFSHKMLHPSCSAQQREEIPSKEQLDLFVRWTLITYQSMLLALGVCNGVKVDYRQPWGSTSQGQEKRPEAGEPGLHPQGQPQRVEEKRLFSFSWGTTRMPSSHSHSTVMLLICPHLGKVQGLAQPEGKG